MIDLSAKVEGQIAEIEQLREALSAMTELFKATEASAQWALSEAERLREALNEIAAWHEGPIGPHMDEPAAASTARLALNKGESHN